MNHVGEDDSADLRVSPLDEVLTAWVGDEVVLWSSSSGHYFSLSGAGARAWQMAAAGCTLSQIVDALGHIYEVDRSVLRDDVRTLLASWIEHRLAVAQGVDAPATQSNTGGSRQ